MLQQHLPLAVLKLVTVAKAFWVLDSCNSTYRLRYWNQEEILFSSRVANIGVATALTACGIETYQFYDKFVLDYCCNSTYRLRYVMKGASRGAKRRWNPHISSPWPKGRENKGDEVTVLTACGIETLINHLDNYARLLKLQQHLPLAVLKRSRTSISRIGESGCNSTYRLRYATKGASRGAKRRWGPHISSPWLEGK